MHKIESNTDLLKWAKDVNTLNCNIPDLQDVFVRSTMSELKQYFIDSQQNDKELIVFSISKCMGSSTLLEFITVYSRHKAEDHIQAENDELGERWDELITKEMEFESHKQKLQVTIENLQHRNSELEKHNDELAKKLSKSYVRNLDLESEIEEMRQDLKKLYNFESHIKELINS